MFGTYNQLQAHYTKRITLNSHTYLNSVKIVLELQRPSCIQCRNRNKLETFEYLTVGDVRKIGSGQLRHPPYFFSFKYALMAIGSNSISVIFS